MRSEDEIEEKIEQLENKAEKYSKDDNRSSQIDILNRILLLEWVIDHD